MKAIQKLHEMGQGLWLDNITRGLPTSGTLRRYIKEFSVTELTSNPTIFDQAIKNTRGYDDAIRQKSKESKKLAAAKELHARERRPNIKSWNELTTCIASKREAMK